MNRILLVAAVIALVSGVVSLAAIRGRDFGGKSSEARAGPRGLTKTDQKSGAKRGSVTPGSAQPAPEQAANHPSRLLAELRGWLVIGLRDDVCGFRLFPPAGYAG